MNNINELFNKENKVYAASGTRKTYAQKKEEARNKAVEWQSNLDDHSYSWGEIAAYEDYFRALAKRYGLVKEFRENCII